ncbi:MAG: PEP-CTERM sorting domain-containing protein [Sedimenticola sp.]
MISRIRLVAATVATGLLALSTSTHAILLSNGTLSVDIDASNGAIASAVYSGSDYYNPGYPVSDWGLQAGTDTTTYRANTTRSSTDSIGVTVTSGTDSVDVSGTFSGVDFTRTYSLASGLDVLITDTIFTNSTDGAVNIRYFDTFDPDQGSCCSTYNDVLTLNGAIVAQAVDNITSLTSIIGDSSDETGFLTSGLAIDSGSVLNSFLAGTLSTDPDGALRDVGMAIAYDLTIGAGESISLSFLHAFGTSPRTAQIAFTSAMVPEPSILALFGLGLAGLGLSRRKKA